MFDESSAGLDQPLLQAGERPEVTRAPWKSTLNLPLNESSKGCSCLSPTATPPPHSPDRIQTLVCQEFSGILSSW